MIPRSEALWQTPPWKKNLAESFTKPSDLLRFLELDERILAGSDKAAKTFPLLVPRFYADLMEKGNANDPLLRQVLPLGCETHLSPGFSEDPVGEADASVATTVLHKYEGRVLLITTPACAVHCRYCFRRHFPFRQNSASQERWEDIFTYVGTRSDIREIILSGGDPLMLNDRALADLIVGFGRFPHIARVRIHTRIPVVLPDRVTSELIRSLRAGRFTPVIVLHVNHPREISGRFADGIARLKRAGMPLLSQSVLLRGINDDQAVLASLSEKLFDAGVLPYYLHMLDKVQGAAHFAIPGKAAVRIQEQLARTLPGYLVPRLVYEQAGAAAKTPLVR